MTFFNKFDRNSGITPTDPYLASIVGNLNNILNTKKNYGSFLTELGLRDLNEFRSRQDIALVVLEEVKQNIAQYEPRVELVDITIQKNDNPFALSFKIDCIVRQNSESLQMVFDTLFNKFLVNNFGD
jgi:type VI secretion system lysozyme-like protein